MKITGIGLIAIGFALLIFAGVSHFALAPTPDGTDQATAPGSPIFSPAISLVVAAIASIAGFLLLRFGGSGYNEQTVKPAVRPQQR